MKIQPLLFLSTALVLAALPTKATAQAAMPVPAAVTADEAPKRFFNYFVPFRTNLSALSPDGKYIAYTLREDDRLSVQIVEIDNPGVPKTKVAVISNEQATPTASINDKELRPAQIRWMGWVTPTRLVVETNRVFPLTSDGISPTRTDANVLNSADSIFTNIVGEIWAFDADGQNARSLLTPRDIPEGIPYSNGRQRDAYRSPHIVDYATDDPESVIVQADGMVRANSLRRVERFKLNVITGKLTELNDHLIETNKNYLFDRQGRPRVAIPISVRDRFPHVMTYDSGTILNRWKPLNELAAPSGHKDFSVSPENYFGERSVPLGFDYDGNLLYFASNTGRDTYGLYGLDMKTGKLSHLAAENPVFDMYAPAPGVFPDSYVFSLFGHGDLPVANETPDASGDTALAAWTANMNTVAGVDDSTAVGSRVSDAEISARAEMQGNSRSIVGRVDGYPLIYDRYTRKLVGFRMEGWTRTARWIKPEFQAVQNDLEKIRPGSSVEIQDWDSAGQRFLVNVSGVTDSGAYFVYDAAKKKLSEFIASAPWHNNRKLHDTTPFGFTTPKGQNVTGLITFPRAARSMPVPVIVVCSSQPWSRTHTEYQAQILTYADMGFAVVQVNPRGTWGFGRKLRETLQDGYEDAQIADISFSLDYLSRGFAINPKRVAIAGDGYGGYLALRSVQIEPKRYRCAIAIETIIDLQGWVTESRWANGDARPQFIQAYLGGADRLKASPLLTKPETIASPILLLSYPGPGGTLQPKRYVDARTLARAVRAQNVSAEVVDLPDDYMAGLPRAHSEIHQKIEDFLNENIYNYKVQAGELKHLKDK